MKCIECGSEQLYGVVRVEVWLPMAAKGGSVKVSGAKVTQIDIKNEWDRASDGSTNPVKEPIVCAACDTIHRYTVGKTPALSLVTDPTATEW